MSSKKEKKADQQQTAESSFVEELGDSDKNSSEEEAPVRNYVSKGEFQINLAESIEYYTDMVNRGQISLAGIQQMINKIDNLEKIKGKRVTFWLDEQGNMGVDPVDILPMGFHLPEKNPLD